MSHALSAPSWVAALLERKYSVVLGSSSYSRRLIMDELCQAYSGLSYSVVAAAIDEKAIRFTNAERLVAELARAKAAAVRGKLGKPDVPTIFITCDQVVTCKGEIREKPESSEQAAEYMRDYRTHPAQTVGGIYVEDCSTGRHAEAVEVAEVLFRELAEDAIAKVIEDGVVMSCSGALMIEHPELSGSVVITQGTEDQIRGLGKDTLGSLVAQVLQI